MRIFYLTLALMLSAYVAQSQVWLEPFLGRENVKLSEIQEVAENYFSTIDISQKGSGFKQYKRFEAFWKERLMPDGTFPKASLIYKELLGSDVKLKHSKTQASSTWQSLGPISSVGGYSGLARVNGVRVNPHNGDLWALTPSGGAWISTDGGSNWHIVTDNEDAISTIGMSSVAFDPTNSNIIYLASGDGDASNTYSLGVFKSTDGGDSWNATGLSWNTTQYTTISKILIDPSNPSILYTAGSSGVNKTTDGGNTWTEVLNGVYKDIEFKPGSSSTLYVSGKSIKKTTNGGTSWSDLTNGLPTSGITRVAIAVSQDSADVLYALFANASGSNLNGVFLSKDGGASFSQIAGSSPNMLGYAKDGSDTKGQASYDLCIEADQDDWKKVIIGGINLWRTVDAGTTWEISSMWWGNHADVSTIHADQHDLWYDNTNNVVYAGNDGGVYKSTDFGENWTWIGSGIKATQFYRFGISQTDSSIYLGGAQDNGTKIHLSDGSWKDAIGGDGFETIVDNSDNSILYASLYYGSFYKSTNSGVSFKRINDLDHDDKYDDITETGAWDTPFIQHPSNSNTLLIGMNNVWISRDKGDNFTKISNFNYGGNKLVNIAMAPSDSNTLYASFSSRLYRTTDFGVTWNMVSRPGNSGTSYIFVDEADSKKIWATNNGFSNGNKVFESTDGGDTWTNISRNLPNIPALTIIKQKGTQGKLWIGTDIGVYYAENSANDWVAFDDGFPNVIVKELEINYTYNQIYAATYGRGIWKADVPSSLDAPEIAEPADSSYGNITKNLEVNWNDVTDATKYVIQVATANDFSNLIVNDTVTSSSLIISSLTNYTTYYARAKALNKYSTSGWSPVVMFTTIVGRVSLISPTNNLIGREVAGELIWSEVAGATEYEIMLSDNQDFSTQIVDQSVTDTKFDYSGLSYYSEYWWKVRAKDPSGSSGDWSFVRKFQTKVDKPTLVSPADQTENLGISQSFDWNDVTGGDKYQLQIADDISFLNIVYDNETTLSEDEVSPLKYYTKYYWRARAKNQTFPGEWSDTFTFTTKIGLTTQKLPENLSINLDTVQTFLWEDESYADDYNFQLDLDANFNTPALIDTNMISNVLEKTELLYDTTYYWRTKINVGAASGEWSEVWSFRTKLKEPKLSQPVDKSSEIPVDGLLKWVGASNSPYRVQIAEDMGFNNVTIDEIADAEEFSYSDLNNDKKYFWRVRGERGEYLSDWSDTWSFDTPVTIDRPQLSYPPNLQRNLKLITLNLKWKELANVSSYKIQIASDNAFGSIIVNDSGLTDNNFDFSDLEYNKVYYWRVQGIRSPLSHSEWSEVWEFSTTLPTPTLVLPLNAEKDVKKSGTMKWNVVTGADSYNVEVATDNQFVNNVAELTTNTTSNELTFTDLENEKTYYWHVNSTNSIALSDWSEVWSFTIENKPTYVTEDNNFGKIKITPNPFESKTSISINLLESNNVKLYVTDINGKHIIDIANKYFKAGVDYDFQFEKGGLSSGVYFLILDYGGQQKSVKLIIN